jgi:hypothetical protein
MLSTLVWFVVCLVLINGSYSANDLFQTKPLTMLPSSIPDTEFEQVIAERYLFAPFANESTVWPVLNNTQYAWQTASLPQYHS